MTSCLRLSAVLIAGLIVWQRSAVGLPPEQGADPPRQTAAAASARWSLDEALSQLRLYPHDPYLQYVVLQLAHRENRTVDAVNQIAGLTQPPDARRARTDQVSLFGIFTGALAVQESLQLDTMLDATEAAPRGGRRVAVPPGDQDGKVAAGDAGDGDADGVSLALLQGPAVKSHPWSEMLAGRRPAMSPLAGCVPDDYYFVQFRSVNKMLTLLDQSDIWGTHLFSQTGQKAYRHDVRARTLRQLALETHPLLQPFYDLAVKEMAVAGSDLYAIEGSDVTLLFQLRQREVFQTQMDGFLARAEQNTPGAVRSSGTYRNVPYVHLTAPGRTVHVFSAYPSADLHVRSNSLVSLQRMLDVITGAPDNAGTTVSSLGSTAEFAYISTLFPYGAEEEDGLIYLSDPFIRRLVGPQVKLTESRRRSCCNHLRMIGHASALYRTEQGAVPPSLDDLHAAGCTTEKFGTGRLVCPAGGQYALTADGQGGACSHHGTADFMLPCCEIPLTTVSTREAQAYQAFVEQYSQYWRTFFDPIALRVQVTPQRYRLETIVLPLIDNSLYTSLAAILGGPPQRLDVPPLPDRTIFSTCVKLDKPKLLQRLGWETAPPEATRLSIGAIQDTATRMRQLGLALHNYHDVHKAFPAIANFDAANRPLLSWRVHVLPYLGHQALYDKFHRDEAWDSPHNRSLIEQMPDLFKSPGAEPAKPGTTRFVVVTGKEAIFRGTAYAVPLAQVTDGTSNTLMTVHVTAQHAVEWTKPADAASDVKTLRDALFAGGQSNAMVGFADGSVRLLPATVADPTLRAIVTCDGREAVDAVGEGVPFPRDEFWGLPRWLARDMTQEEVRTFVVQGLGDQIGLHTYDADQFFDFQLIGALGQAAGSFAGRQGWGFNDDFLPFIFLGASLNSPVYVSVRLADTELVDRFLSKFDQSLAAQARERERGGFFRVDQDFYRLPLAGGVEARSYGFQVGPVKWRFFWARLGDTLYIASKPYILEDLAAKLVESVGPTGVVPQVSDLAAHAMIRIRPRHWQQVLPAYRLGWAERHRLACLENVGRLSSVARVVEAQSPAVAAGAQDLDPVAAQIYGLRFYCPEGGQYLRDGHAVRCSLHGTALDPRQHAIPADNGAIDSLLQGFSDLTVTLTFLDDGLHAVLLIDRQ